MHVLSVLLERYPVGVLMAGHLGVILVVSSEMILYLVRLPLLPQLVLLCLDDPADFVRFTQAGSIPVLSRQRVRSSVGEVTQMVSFE